MQEQQLLITSHVTIATAKCFFATAKKFANSTAAIRPYKLPDNRVHTFLNSAKNLHSSVLPRKLKESIQHWISRDRSHQHAAAVTKCGWYCTSCCITCVQHSALLSPFGTNLLIWIQDFWNFFGTFKSLLFSSYKYKEEGTNLPLADDDPAIRKVKLLCHGNWLAKVQEAGSMWKPSEQCKENKLCHTQLWQDCVNK